MAYLTEKLEKLEKKLKKSKSKISSKKRVRDSSSDSSDSKLDNGYSSLSTHLDERFKLGKPLGINYTSSNTRPIKAPRTALEIIKANEKSIENSKTGKVSAVVAIIKIFSKNFSNSRNPNSRRKSVI
jgi:hypothetical protein